MDFMNMFGDMQAKMEAAKARLDTITVDGKAGDDQLIVTMTGNKKVTNVKFAATLLEEGDTEQIEDLMVIAINRAIESADQVTASEMSAVTGGLNIPGLNF